MKVLGWNLLTVSVVLLGWAITAEFQADYEYSRSIGSYWELSVKASTLSAKSEYLNKFIAAIDNAHISGNDAIWQFTPDNSAENNISTLKTLQSRMNEIKGMDVQSFAYQQAIQQITAQEQDEATKTLNVIQGCWYKSAHPLLWGLYDGIKWMILLLLGGGALLCLAFGYDW